MPHLWALAAELKASLRRLVYRGIDRPIAYRSPSGTSYLLAPGDLVSEHTYAYGMYERPLIRLLEREFLPRFGRGTFVDIGANIGTYALNLRSHFSRVIAFEPSPLIHARLLENIRRTGAANIEVHRIGLSDATGSLLFREIAAGNMGASAIVEEGAAARGGSLIRIDTEPGDAVLERLGAADIAFIKIDVEGHEVHAVRGLAGTVARCRPLIAFEWDGKKLGREDFAALAVVLDGYDFLEVVQVEYPKRFAARVTHALRTGCEARAVPFGFIAGKYYPAVLALPRRPSPPA